MKLLSLLSIFVFLASSFASEDSSVFISECRNAANNSFEKIAAHLGIGNNLVSHLQFTKSFQDPESGKTILVYESSGIEDSSGVIIYNSKVRSEMAVFEDGCEVSTFFVDTGSKFME